MILKPLSDSSAKKYIGRFCAIDIGTVTCRMLISDVFLREDSSFELSEISKLYDVVNLGENVDSTHRLSEAALTRVKDTLEHFIDERDHLSTSNNPVVSTTVMATSATRDADNSNEFVKLLEELGLKLQVISGEQEASLSFLGASEAYSGEKVAVVDVGGGSTEISIGIAGNDLEYSHSFDVGCRRITERFWDGYPCSEINIELARNWVSTIFEAVPRSVVFGCTRMIAVAGTATSIVTIDKEMAVYDSSKVNGVQISKSKLESIERRLSVMDLFELEHVVGLDPRRAPVIIGGFVILEEAMKAIDMNAYTASESDILEGIVMYNAKQYIASS